ncbi:NADH-quinone oxidoreductase subunit L [Thermodesulfovibrionales bacterium]|nr:NADH-quinone oxidoreductase subunit L [Thermodesulfovibrionales bacterium]
MQTWILILLLLPLLVAPLAIPISKLGRQAVGLFSVISVFIPLAVIFSFLPEILKGETIVISLPFVWFAISDIIINFEQLILIDRLSWILLFVASFVGGLCLVYSVGYMKNMKKLGYFYFWMLLFIGSMLGLVSTDNILFLVIFWELTTLASFGLISYWYERPVSLKSAFKALIITGAGGFCLIVASLILIVDMHTFSIHTILTNIAEINPAYLPIVLVLIAIAALTKSAQVPFHPWLPAAMVAPTPVSALLHAATMVKAGVYLYARFLPLYSEHPIMATIVLLIASVSILVSSLNVIRTGDAKEILAYHTIGQLGYMFLALSISALAWEEHRSIAEMAFVGGMLHLVFHAFFKSTLFLIVGAVEHKTGTRNLNDLGGVSKVMPVTAGCFIISALAISGIPPLNGFVSKLIIYWSALSLALGQFPIIGIIAISIAMAGSVLTMFSFLKSIYCIFFGEMPKRFEHIRESPFSMRGTYLLLTSLCVITGIAPFLFIRVLHPEALGWVWLLGPDTGVSMVAVAALLVLGAAIGAIAYLWTRRTPRVSSPYLGGHSLGEGYEGGKITSHGYTMELTSKSNKVCQIFDFDKYNEWFASRVLEGSQTFRKIHTGSLYFYMGWIFMATIALSAVILW